MKPLALLLLLLSLPLSAQVAERIEVNIVNVDVVVTDKDGNIVTGLTKDDFELRENGVVRPIANFYEAAGQAREPNVQVEALAPGAARPQPAPQAAAHPLRIIFFIDNASLTAGRRALLLEQMRKFATETMREGDEAMVVAQHQTVNILTNFTSDRERLEAAFVAATRSAPAGDRLRFAAASVETEIAAELDANVRLSYALSWAHERMGDLRNTVNAFDALLKTIAGVEGKKALVFASESFPIQPGREMFEACDRWTQPIAHRRIVKRNTPSTLSMPTQVAGGEKFGRALLGSETNPDMPVATQSARQFDARKFIEQIASRANASSVTLYPLHAGTQAGSEEASADMQRGGKIAAAAFAARASTEQAMQLVADLTGGVAWTRTGRFDLAFDRLRRELDGYYSLGFRAGEGSKGERRIDVKLKNKSRGYTVRSRRAYTAKTAEETIQERVVGNLFARATTADLPITVQAFTPKAEQGKLLVPVQVRIPVDALVVPGSVDIYVVAATPRGDMSDVVRRTEPIAAKSPGGYHTYAMQLLMEPGARVSVGVLDRSTNAMGFGTYEVDAP